MARLDYDVDNFSGTHSRGTRYALLVDGVVEKTDLSARDADYFAELYNRKGYYGDIEVIEI